MILVEDCGTSKSEGNEEAGVSWPASWRWRPALHLGLMSLLFAGCSSHYSTRVTLTRQITAATKEAADLLATVKDEPTAQAAAPKLRAVCDRMEKLTEQFDAFDTENEIYMGEQEQKVLEEHARWIAEEIRRMQEQARISRIPEARAGLGDVWMQLTGGAFAPGGPMDLGAAPSAGAAPPGSSVPPALPVPQALPANP